MSYKYRVRSISCSKYKEIIFFLVFGMGNFFYQDVKYMIGKLLGPSQKRGVVHSTKKKKKKDIDFVPNFGQKNKIKMGGIHKLLNNKSQNQYLI